MLGVILSTVRPRKQEHSFLEIRLCSYEHGVTPTFRVKLLFQRPF